MKLSDLAKKAARLPEIDFEYGGPESWHEAVFNREVTDHNSLKEYVTKLKERAQEQTLALLRLKEAYEALREIILEADVGDPDVEVSARRSRAALFGGVALRQLDLLQSAITRAAKSPNQVPHLTAALSLLRELKFLVSDEAHEYVSILHWEEIPEDIRVFLAGVSAGRRANKG